MSVDKLVRDIEMSYEMLFAFLQLHGDDPDADINAAWGAARDQVREAITKDRELHTTARAQLLHCETGGGA